MRMISLSNCFKERNGLLMSGKHDELVELLFSDEESDYAFVTFAGYFDRVGADKLIPDGCTLRCCFELGPVLSGSRACLEFFWFTRARVKECKFAKMKIAKPLLPSSGHRGAFGSIEEERFSEEYLKYLTACEQYAEGETPKGVSKIGAFYSVPVTEMVPGRYSPSFYTPDNRRIRRELAQAKTVPLEDIAEVFVPRKLKGGEPHSLLLRPKDVRFPVDFSNLDRGEPTTVCLEVGDVVLCTVGGDNRSIVFDLETDEKAYASTSTAVIRAHGISPEYLCFYLSSEIAKVTLSTLGSGIVLKQLRLSSLRTFPVVLPVMDSQYYLTEYAILAGRVLRDYRDLEQLKQGKPEAIEAILDTEIASRIDAYYENQLREFLTSDITELNTCFRHGAYKAAIILAGSILEAVLIDWLSEIKHVNYFEEDYYVRDHRTGRTKRADLLDYINEIKFLERPRWAKEADMAHTIRRKRNLIHAKLCIDSDEVNEKTARMVIDYLDKVLRTRGANCKR